MVVKKYKLADQDQFNQKIAYKGPALAPRDTKSILQQTSRKTKFEPLKYYCIFTTVCISKKPNI